MPFGCPRASRTGSLGRRHRCGRRRRRRGQFKGRQGHRRTLALHRYHREGHRLLRREHPRGQPAQHQSRRHRRLDHGCDQAADGGHRFHRYQRHLQIRGEHRGIEHLHAVDHRPQHCQGCRCRLQLRQRRHAVHQCHRQPHPRPQRPGRRDQQLLHQRPHPV